MTVEQVEENYKSMCTRVELNHAEERTKKLVVFTLLAVALLIAGICFAVGACTPTDEYVDVSNIVCSMMALLAFAFIIYPISFLVKVSNSKPDYSSANKKLYLEYIRCDDISDSEKKYYEILLEEMRSERLSGEISRATNRIAASVLLSATWINNNKDF